MASSEIVKVEQVLENYDAANKSICLSTRRSVARLKAGFEKQAQRFLIQNQTVVNNLRKGVLPKYKTVSRQKYLDVLLVAQALLRYQQDVLAQNGEFGTSQVHSTFSVLGDDGKLKLNILPIFSEFTVQTQGGNLICRKIVRGKLVKTPMSVNTRVKNGGKVLLDLVHKPVLLKGKVENSDGTTSEHLFARVRNINGKYLGRKGLYVSMVYLKASYDIENYEQSIVEACGVKSVVPQVASVPVFPNRPQSKVSKSKGKTGNSSIGTVKSRVPKRHQLKRKVESSRNKLQVAQEEHDVLKEKFTVEAYLAKHINEACDKADLNYSYKQLEKIEKRKLLSIFGLTASDLKKEVEPDKFFNDWEPNFFDFMTWLKNRYYKRFDTSITSLKAYKEGVPQYFDLDPRIDEFFDNNVGLDRYGFLRTAIKANYVVESQMDSAWFSRKKAKRVCRKTKSKGMMQIRVTDQSIGLILNSLSKYKFKSPNLNKVVQNYKLFISSLNEGRVTSKQHDDYIEYLKNLFVELVSSDFEAMMFVATVYTQDNLNYISNLYLLNNDFFDPVLNHNDFKMLITGYNRSPYSLLQPTFRKFALDLAAIAGFSVDYSYKDLDKMPAKMGAFKSIFHNPVKCLGYSGFDTEEIDKVDYFNLTDEQRSDFDSLDILTEKMVVAYFKVFQQIKKSNIVGADKITDQEAQSAILHIVYGRFGKFLKSPLFKLFRKYFRSETGFFPDLILKDKHYRQVPGMFSYGRKVIRDSYGVDSVFPDAPPESVDFSALKAPSQKEECDRASLFAGPNFELDVDEVSEKLARTIANNRSIQSVHLKVGIRGLSNLSFFSSKITRLKIGSPLLRYSWILKQLKSLNLSNLEEFSCVGYVEDQVFGFVKSLPRIKTLDFARTLLLFNQGSPTDDVQLRAFQKWIAHSKTLKVVYLNKKDLSLLKDKWSKFRFRDGFKVSGVLLSEKKENRI